MAKYRWTVEYTVDEMWIADGFNLTDERALAMLQRDLSYAHRSEIKARVIKRPTDREIAKAQGFSTVAAFKAARP